MSAVVKPFIWFYHAFGVDSIHETGRNAYLIILARSCRMFAYGTNSLILAIFFSALGFQDSQIGFFFTFTLLGDVFLGTILTLIADRVGRRKVLLFGSFLMILSGVVFAYFENFWILLVAATLGVISVTGGDFGPFRSIEESILSQLTTPKTRADVLAWYVTTSTLGVSIGSEASGRIIHHLQRLDGWDEVRAYHVLFLIYTLMGLVNVLLVLLLSNACELDSDKAENTMYAQVPQDEEDDAVELTTEAERRGREQRQRQGQLQHPLPGAPPHAPRSLFDKSLSWFTTRLAHISRPTLSIMIKLWLLLALDSLADGMVPYSLTNYYIDTKFHPSKSTLGDVTGVSYFLGAISSAFAGPLARKIGLINTMVYTHIPSSAAVLLFPFPDAFWLTVLLLLVRAGLNNMDQAPRSAFIAAVVKPNERTAAMGITSMLRTLAAMAGPTVTGILAGGGRFWIAFVVAGACRLAYDCGLWLLFVNVKLYQHETDDRVVVDDDDRGVDETESPPIPRSDEQEEQEMQEMKPSGPPAMFKIGDDDDDEDKYDNSNKETAKNDIPSNAPTTGSSSSSSRGANLNVPTRPQQRVRSRSPHQRVPSYP